MLSNVEWTLIAAAPFMSIDTHCRLTVYVKVDTHCGREVTLNRHSLRLTTHVKWTLIAAWQRDEHRVRGAVLRSGLNVVETDGSLISQSIEASDFPAALAVT
jgi:hypothetical protein